MNRFSLFIFIAFSFKSLLAADTLYIDRDFSKANIIPAAELLIYERDQEIPNTDDPNWVKAEGKAINILQNGKAFYLKFYVQNLSSKRDYLIHAVCPYLDHFEYCYNEQNKVIGDIYPYENRAYDDSHPILDLDLDSGETAEIILKIRSTEDAIFQIFLREKEQYYINKADRNLVYGLYGGIIGLIIILNLSMYMMVRDMVYLKYVFYIVFVALTQFTIFGDPLRLFYGAVPFLSENDFVLFPAGVLIAGLEFFISYHFLRKGQIAYICARVIQGATLIGLIVFGLTNRELLFDFYNILNFLSAVYGLITSGYYAFKGSKLAAIFLAAWITFLIGSITFILELNGVIPFSYAANYAMPVGTALEAMLLTAAVAYRMKALKVTSDSKDELIEMQQMLTTAMNSEIGQVKLQNLRSQMNPHFLFNALSTLNSFIEEKDMDHASYYLGTISGLLRTSITILDGKLISIEKEIGFLEEYIRMEKLSKPNLEFNLEIDPKIDPFDSFIPPYMLQPFIENSLKHAFNKDQVNPTITLGFHELSEERLLLVVEDNGKGIPEGHKYHNYYTSLAAEAESDQEYIANVLEATSDYQTVVTSKTSVESKGIEIILRRIDILNSLFPNYKAQLSIVNKAEGGVKVSIELPILYYQDDRYNNN
ncbi:hypothetical protein GYB22_11755 [bacterium]|nr:hypothetical protein [bacterium]